jgi:hypothetical protein
VNSSQAGGRKMVVCERHNFLDHVFSFPKRSNAKSSHAIATAVSIGCRRENFKIGRVEGQMDDQKMLANQSAQLIA